MKREPWLIGSLALNVVLATGWVWFVATREPFNSAVSADAGQPNASATSDRAPQSENTASIPTETAASAGAAEWPRWLTPLRAAGVSEAVLAGLVTADFERRWELRLTELQRQYENGDLDAAALARAHGEHESEQEKELRLALGDDGFLRWDRERTLREFTLAGVSLAESEREAVYAVSKMRIQQRRALEQANGRGEIDDLQLTERLSEVEMEYHRRLEPLLGQERYGALHVPVDDLGAELRRELRHLDLPADRIYALADIQRARDLMQAELEQQAESGASPSLEYEARRQAIDAARDQQFQRLLGPENYAEYRKTNDPRYQMMQRYAAAWRIGPSEIAHLYGTLAAFENAATDQRQQALQAERQGLSVDWAAVEQRIGRMASETENSLRSTLGQERFEQLKRHDALRLER